MLYRMIVVPVSSISIHYCTKYPTISNIEFEAAKNMAAVAEVYASMHQLE